MSDLKMGTAEARFADIIWEKEPITSGQLAQIGLAEFNWKRTTSHTVLNRLCDRGLFQKENGVVTSLISREEYYARHSEAYVEETFGGSLPAFLAAFGTRKKFSDKEIDELQKVIDSMRGGNYDFLFIHASLTKYESDGERCDRSCYSSSLCIEEGS